MICEYRNTNYKANSADLKRISPNDIFHHRHFALSLCSATSYSIFRPEKSQKKDSLNMRNEPILNKIRSLFRSREEPESRFYGTMRFCHFNRGRTTPFHFGFCPTFKRNFASKIFPKITNEPISLIHDFSYNEKQKNQPYYKKRFYIKYETQ